MASRTSTATRSRAKSTGTPTTEQASPAIGAQAPAAPFGMSMQNWSNGLSDILANFDPVLIPPEKIQAIQQQYFVELGQLWTKLSVESVADLTQGHHTNLFDLKDRRFSSPAWQSNALHAFNAAVYLLNNRTMMALADAVEADAHTKQKIQYAVEQWMAATAPSNFLATNPEAQQRIIETKGASLRQGMINMLADLEKKRISQSDESAFEIGKNLATTPGAVVFENELFQLIQYQPTTPQVHEKPLLIVPPCINKFYIMDLQPENSLVRYIVSQGFTVMLVSWRNPGKEQAHLNWDDYIETGVIKAMHVAVELSASLGNQSGKINALGFCVGGTLLGTAASVLADRKDDIVDSLTFLTTFLDFSDTGILDIFVDEAAVKLREQTIGGMGGKPVGLMSGTELASTFSSLRPNDLVWNYVVGNYLKGEVPPAFDLLYWNGDGTNLPGPMFCWYLRNTYLENNLIKPGKVTCAGSSVDLGKINVPVYLYASREDHIVPWHSAYASTQILQGDKRFVLGASGHIAGVINPVSKNKRNYWINENLPAKAEQWLASATEHPGSWWPDWINWLTPLAGKKIKAPASLGSAQFPVVEAAPGSYVRARPN